MSDRADTPADKLRAAFVKTGAPIEGLDFDKIAAAQDGRRDVPHWEAPRVLPAAWREVERYADGARYQNAAMRLSVILTCSIEDDRRPWLHLSVKHAQRIPTWGELRVCKELFLDDRVAYQVLPSRAQYVNLHQHVLHLFALLDEQARALPDFTGGTGSI